jgi:putative membrane protein
MQRRTLLAGFAAGAALAAKAALAQSAAPANKAGMPASGLSDAVKKHIKDTMTVGAESLMISRIAQAKLNVPMGKQFADFEVAEQDGIADVLKSRMMPGAKPMGTIKAPTDAEVEGNLDADGKTMVAKFRDMKGGPEFEKSYIQAEIEGHKKLLGIQDAYLQVADDEDETNIAKLAKGRIQEHLVILADIEKHLG